MEARGSCCVPDGVCARRPFVEPDELIGLLKLMPHEYRPLFALAYITGWRIESDLLTRQWRHVDFAGQGCLRIDRGEQASAPDGRTFRFTQPMRDMLQRQRAWVSTVEQRLGAPVPWVFCRADGRVIRGLRPVWRRACQRAGLTQLPGDLRRTAIRNLDRAGVPRAAAKAMVGYRTEWVYRRLGLLDEEALGKLGPQIGEAAPPFTLLDHHGDLRTLESTLRGNGGLLVFLRSADWCHFCKTQLADLQSHFDVFRHHGVGIVTISRDGAATLDAAARRLGIEFPMLSDPDSSTMARYGLLNREVSTTSHDFGTPHPGTFVLDRCGVVTHRFFERRYPERATAASMLVHLGLVKGAAASRWSTPRVLIETSMSDIAAAPGSRLTLLARLSPVPGVSVRAAAGDGSRAPAIALQPTPHILVRDRSMLASPERQYVSEGGRSVRVFRQPFCIAQDVTIDASPDSQAALAGATSVRISGVVEFRACDGTRAYAPESTPVSWVVHLKPLIR